MDYEMMRLKCLELATAQGLKGDEALKAADKMLKFCRDRQEVEGAIYYADRIETPKATIHRRPPFTDYTPEKDKGE